MSPVICNFFPFCFVQQDFCSDLIFAKPSHQRSEKPWQCMHRIHLLRNLVLYHIISGYFYFRVKNCSSNFEEIILISNANFIYDFINFTDSWGNIKVSLPDPHSHLPLFFHWHKIKDWYPPFSPPWKFKCKN